MIGFNPIARNARVMTYQVVALMEAIRKCFGQGSFQETPRLARWLFNVAYALVSSGLTLVQAQHLVNPGPSPMRAAICGRITNPRIRAEWDWLESMKIDKREERIESTLNRIKPFVEHEITVRAYSSSESDGESSGHVDHSSLASGQVWIPGSDFWSSPTLTSTSRSSGSGSSRSSSHQSAYSSGTTETTVPFYEFHEYRELTSRTFRSLEEQLYLKKAQLKRQPNQHAAVLLPGQNVQLIKVATLRDLPVSGSQCEEFRQTCIDTAGCYKSPEGAEAELVALEEKLLLEARTTITVAAEPQSGEEKIGPSKAPVPIWSRTTAPGSAERTDRKTIPQRGGSKRAL